MSIKTGGRICLVGLYVISLVIPFWVFIGNRGGIDFLSGFDPRSLLKVLFPLLGLYTFTFITFQVLIATNLWWLKSLWPSIIKFHRFQGTFALLFALLHPFFILLSYGMANYFQYRFVSDNQRLYLLPAYVALTIMIMTVITATIAWKGRRVRYWRQLHKLNYAVFPLAWTHSWFIGSDTSTPSLRTLWVLYVGLVVISVAGKYRQVLAQNNLPAN
jgi:DMSO/TMAO reductase YedYZ heme-binding membrane subunit